MIANFGVRNAGIRINSDAAADKDHLPTLLKEYVFHNMWHIPFR